MSSPVVVLSRDGIRGSILKKILTQNGHKVLWLKNVYDAGDALGKHVPRVMIFDAKGLYLREIEVLEKLRLRLPETEIIVLAEAGVIPTYETQGFPSELCLPEPIDPELVVSKVKEILASLPVNRSSADKTGSESESEKEVGKDTWTGFLKQFLKLD